MLLAAASMASAQTWTACNPMKNTCPADPALGATLSTDFTAGASKDWKVTNGEISYNGQGAVFTVAKKGDSPTIQTNDYFFFGTAEVKMQAAPGTGIVSSIVLESDDLDEIDWEALGGDNTQIETNYFGKDNTGTYNRATYVNLNSPQTTSYTYTVDWQKDQIQWLINGNVVRTLLASDAGEYFPQTPMTLRIGIWAGGDSGNAPGTIQWAGGVTDYSKGPFTMYVESVTIKNANPGKSYTYSDNSGSADSIKIDGSSSPDPTTSAATTTSVHSTTSAHPTTSAEPTTSAGHGTTTSVPPSHTSTAGDGTTTAPSGTATGKTGTLTTVTSATPSTGVVPGSGNSTTTPGSSHASSTSTTAPVHTGGAISSVSTSGSLVALYGFLAAMVAYVL
ncbi:concanavalin A-like lectin/glucanase domain-containing protein [Talaromyces proteolyticus]|uniref:Crh-like protein n=1 Tax=Talaromyces proteolyticus TaxID=1131652 RepID=A0AAD4Q1F2_9EURO|nr:concanavalin A-like lectin/glucanase domain-containing protein [Talaromyces proteolyticus]KAH8698654.1 concanavalin A-like lectin/glucanase domain-containing protein [Talaromyces proteolyticus]